MPSNYPSLMYFPVGYKPFIFQIPQQSEIKSSFVKAGQSDATGIFNALHSVYKNA